MKKHLLQREQFCALLFCSVSFLTFYGRNCQAGRLAKRLSHRRSVIHSIFPIVFLRNPRHGERRPIPRSFVKWSSPVASGSGPPPSRPSPFLLKQLASCALRKLLTALLCCSGAFTNLTFMDSKWHIRWHCAAKTRFIIVYFCSFSDE